MTKVKKKKYCFVNEKFNKIEIFKQHSVLVKMFAFFSNNVDVLNDFSYNYKRLFRARGLNHYLCVQHYIR